MNKSNKTERIVSTISILSQKPSVSAGELAQKLNVSERSAYRYLKDLRRFGYSLQSIKEPETARYRHFLNPLTFTAGEALAIMAAGKSFLSQEGLPYCKELQSALDKVKAAISEIEEKRKFYKMEPKFSYISEKLRDYTPWMEHIRKIEECIRNNRTITLIYESFSSGQVSERTLDPYHLYWNEGNLYLAAYCHVNKSMRSFKINRIKKLKKVGGAFTPDPGFNIDKYLGNSWRVYRGSKEIRVHLLVYPPAEKFFLESQYHDSQEIEKLPGGKIKCALTVYDTPEFRSWLLSWGKHIEVIAPKELREEIKVELMESVKRYGGKP